MSQYYSITQLANDLGITARSIRFYETKKLLAPDRVGSQRVYTYRDRARLQLILRGKRLGFSLADIREYLELYESEMEQDDQLLLLHQKVQRRLQELKQQEIDLRETVAELQDMKSHIEDEMDTRGIEIRSHHNEFGK